MPVTKTVKKTFKINGKNYDSIEDLPEEVQKMIDQDGNGEVDFFEQNRGQKSGTFQKVTMSGPTSRDVSFGGRVNKKQPNDFSNHSTIIMPDEIIGLKRLKLLLTFVLVALVAYYFGVAQQTDTSIKLPTLDIVPIESTTE